MIRRGVWLVFALALAVAPAAIAQTVAVAQLSGTVVDDSGGALPGVEVTVTQTATGASRFVITEANGTYVFTNLPIGPYKLTAKLTGFSTYEQTGIVLTVGDTRSANVKMTVGGLTETITVSADAGQVQTQSLSVGSVTPQELIVNLPLNGRSATQLLVLQGGAVEGGTTAGNRGFPGQVAISVAGGTSNSTQYLVDGGYNNDPQLNAGNVIPFPDALQEFRTEAGVRDARYGMSTGATVNAVTKSGTNQFRGNVFEFMRDHQFNALRFFEKTENGGLGRDDGLNRHQFGGTIGGPIQQNKLFFFFGVQATVNKQRPLDNDQFLPTAEMLQGDFRRVMSAACRGGTARTLGAPFVNNQVDPSLFHPLSLSIVRNYLPAVNPALDPDGCGRYPIALPDDSKDQQFVTRADYQVTTNKRVFFRDFYAHFEHPAAFNKDQPNLLEATGTGSGNRALQHTIATGLDYVITSRLFSSTRVAYQHTYAIRENGAGVPTLGTLGVKSFMYTTGDIPGQDMLKLGLWNSGNTGQFYVDTPSISQDVDWTKGAHTLSFGGSWSRPSSDGDGPFQADGQFTFNGIITSGTTQTSGGYNLADFLLGYPQNYRLGGSQINNEYVHAVGVYAADVWRVNKNVTLNYGLRWEPFLAPKDRNGFTTLFSRELFDQGVRSVVYPNAPVGLLFKGDPGFPDNNANSFNQYKQFAPRFGIVFDPTGEAKQTIRAGFGIYYDSPKLWTTAHHMLNAPFGNTVDAVRPTVCPGQPNKNQCPVNFVDPWSSTPGGDPLAAIGYPHMGGEVLLPPSNAVFPTSGVYVSMPVDAHPMQSYQYNVSYQRDLARGILLDVTYTGNQQRHIWIAGYAENPAVYIPGTCAAGQYGLTAAGPCSNTTTANRQARAILTLLNPKEGAMYNVNTGGQSGIAQMYSDAEGHYNGLRIGVQRRLNSGWSANANYTLSKCINQGEPTTDIGWSIPGTLVDPFTNPVPDATLAEGPCAADRRHIFNATSVLISPGLGRGITKALTKDWQLALIFQKRTGSPLTPGVTNDNALTGEANQRPVIVDGVDPYLEEPVWVANHTQLQWINMAAFANAAQGQQGNTYRGIIYGPGFWNADLAFSRTVGVGGARRVEMRVEAFNLFNHVNWANPNVTVDNANAGRITNTSGDPRIMQFALKYAF
jgi:hypothetical protein